ncbi:MAG: helix-turn-helix transcriptional regulator [Intestinimonas butyriciproducens]|nr:helix-turn-helix transcriptional regulator [Intestinimonas butyriciproducens]MCI6364018.1 helix-turn-helix transcriptional regulator [Intestinimonas butyriciproducens]
MAALVGITQPFYNEIERGTKKPSLEVFFKICEVLHISVMSEASDDHV